MTGALTASALTGAEIAAGLDGWLRPGMTDGEAWTALAAAGALGIPFSERHGGLGLSAADAIPVLAALGVRGIATGYLETVILAGSLLDRAGGPIADEWLPRITAGQARLAVAWIDGDDPARAEPDPAGWRLSGRKLLAVGAAEADAAVVIAGGAALLVPRPLLAMHAYPTIDGRRAADIVLDGLVVEADARLATDPGAIDAMSDLGAAAVAAEAAAIMARLVTDTRDYGGERRQFGQPIAAFQIVQHRLVDMLIAARQAAAAAGLAADALARDPAARAKAVSAAKVTIADTGRFVGQNAVQLHGAMGMTAELPASALFKRLTVIESEFGTRDEHLARYMASDADTVTG